MTKLEERLAFSHSRSLTAFGFKKSCELLCNLISCKMYSESYDSLNWIEDLQFQSWTGDWQHLKFDLLKTANPKAHAHPSLQWKLPGLMFYTAKAGDSSSWIYWMQQMQKCMPSNENLILRHAALQLHIFACCTITAICCTVFTIQCICCIWWCTV